VNGGRVEDLLESVEVEVGKVGNLDFRNVVSLLDGQVGGHTVSNLVLCLIVNGRLEFNNSTGNDFLAQTSVLVDALDLGVSSEDRDCSFYLVLSPVGVLTCLVLFTPERNTDRGLELLVVDAERLVQVQVFNPVSVDFTLVCLAFLVVVLVLLLVFVFFRLRCRISSYVTQRHV